MYIYIYNTLIYLLVSAFEYVPICGIDAKGTVIRDASTKRSDAEGAVPPQPQMAPTRFRQVLLEPDDSEVPHCHTTRLTASANQLV